MAKLKEAQEQFQKDMMGFYQSHKVNPLGGCFPMIIQLPVLIALFWGKIFAKKWANPLECFF
jgi:YidC/Oxa1 family membrane protein insertase